MARTKIGLDYFSVDCQLDQKSLLFVLEFGAKGLGILTALKMKIFGENGFYSEWNDDVALAFGHMYGLGPGVVNEAVSACLRRGIFHQQKFEKFGILTSKEIQEEYANATARRISQKIDGRYLLIPMPSNWIDVNRNKDNVDIIAENVDSFAQRREEESRVDSSIHSIARECNDEDDETSEPDTFRKLLGGIGKNVVMLSDEQMADLLSQMSLEEFNHYVEVVADCEINGKKYRKKTHYQAILDMAKKDRKIRKNQQEEHKNV